MKINIVCLIDLISFIYSGICVNSETTCNVVLIILSFRSIAWLIHVYICYPHKVNSSPSLSGLRTNFSGITYYIFVEKTVPVRGLYVLSLCF